ncbi:MAG: hypothetical protein N0C90_02405 [Candidatus Thiodiazotropha endolucinida]|nr:hypothetical protein [Candidatus Thiodiazotropha taylori]MCW4260201.1 hypothetical protein [Candidatus Thiodiazotropha endolucinida]
MTKVDDKTRQREFERGQEYAKNIQPLNRPVQGAFEDDEHYEGREDGFKDGISSIENDPNQ